MKFIAAILTAIAGVASTMGSQACLHFFLDEPEMPNSLIVK